MVLTVAIPCANSATRSSFWPPHTCALFLAFQHPFVSKVTSNRALRELVAEAKAEVMEEIEDSRDEAEEDDSSESASVSTPGPCLLVRLWWRKEPSNFSQRQKAGLWLFWAPSGGGRSGFLGREGLFFGSCQGHRNNDAGGWPSCPLAGGACKKFKKKKKVKTRPWCRLERLE